MNIKSFMRENVYRMFFTVCAAVLAASAVLRIYGVSSPSAISLCAVVSTLLAAVVYFNRKSPALYICMSAAVVIILSVLLAAKIPFADFISDSFESLILREELATGEKMFICALTAFLFSVFFYLLTSIKAIRYALLALSVGLMAFYGFRNVSANAPEIFSTAGMILSALSEVRFGSVYARKSGAMPDKVMSFLLPVILLFSLTASLIPSPEEPISWQGVKDFIASARKIVSDINADIGFIVSPELSEFGIGMQGYSEEGSGFSREVIPLGRVEMTISVFYLRSSLYLVGTANDVYDGTGWKRSSYDSEWENDYYLDYCETIGALERAELSEEEEDMLVRRNSVVVSYENIKTKTLFYPLKTYDIYDYDGSVYKTEAPSIVFKRAASSDTKYKLSYLEIDYSSENFAKMAREGYSYSDSKLPDGLDIFSSGTRSQLADRSAYIQKKFTVLPDGITQRTYDLADEITADCTNDYDKLTAIEAYLSENYAYTLSPGDVPEGSDPVDYFLFESREGYCTYFASAMAVLARCEDIPTRYVQGFLVDSKAAGTAAREVKRSEAHAWTEAYIEGVGWIPFEPTASFSDSRYDYSTTDEIPASIRPDYGRKDVVTADIDGEGSSDERENEAEDSSVYFIAAALTLLGIVLFFAAYVAIRILNFRIRYRKSTVSERMLICYGMITFICGRKKIRRTDGETADSFAERVSKIFDTEGKTSFREITETFDKIRYGGKDICEEEMNAAEEYIRDVFTGIAQQRERKTDALLMFIFYCLR